MRLKATASEFAEVRRSPSDRKPPLLITQAADALGLKPSTLRAWVLRRKIAYLKIGRAIRIEQSTIDEIIEAARVPSREVRG